MRTLLCLCLIALLLPSSALAEDAVAAALDEMRLRSNNRYIEVPQAGSLYYYAQNNPYWNRMEYEAQSSSSFRVFGDGGCCPTSAAIAIGAHLTDDELPRIALFSLRQQGYGLTVDNMNPIAPNPAAHWLTQPWEYRENLPLVFGSFAAGNNYLGEIWRAKPRQEGVSAGGTGNGFVPVLCQLYGLEAIQAVGRYNMEWLSYVRRGATAVALANTQWQPFAKGKGHYVAVVAADDQYLYIMDPQNKTDYERDQKLWSILELVEPGLVRVKLEDYDLLHFSLLWVIRKPTEEKTPDPLPATDWADGRFSE